MLCFYTVCNFDQYSCDDLSIYLFNLIDRSLANITESLVAFSWFCGKFFLIA